MQIVSLTSKLRLVLLTALLVPVLGTRRQVSVQLNMPWYIKFIFTSTSDFKPFTLWGARPRINAVSGETEHIYDLQFSSISNETAKTFRNSVEQQFKAGDVINYELEYADAESRRRKVTFEYIIGDKKTDHLFINTIDQFPSVKATSAGVTKADKVSSEAQESLSTSQSSQCACESNLIAAESEKRYQAAVVDTLMNHWKYTKLILKHRNSHLKFNVKESNAVDFIREFIVEKLKLPRLEYRILQAQYSDEGLLFEMAGPKDAVDILIQSKMLTEKDYEVSTTERDFIEISMLQRGLDSKRR